MGHISNDEIQRTEEVLKACYQKSTEFCEPTEKWQHDVMREIRNINSQPKPGLHTLLHFFKELSAPVSMVATSVLLLVGVYISTGNYLSTIDMIMLYAGPVDNTEYHLLLKD